MIVVLHAVLRYRVFRRWTWIQRILC